MVLVLKRVLHVGAALSITDRLFVGGESEFIGIVTFRGGTVRLGDSVTDDIVVGGEFASSLVPDDDDTFDLGSAITAMETFILRWHFRSGCN